MKSMVYTLVALLLLSGCSQSKNRLADDNNVEYQKKNASKVATSAVPKSEVVDLPTAPTKREQSQELSQKPKTAEPTPTPEIPARNESVEGVTPTAPVAKNEKPKVAVTAPAKPAATGPSATASAPSAPPASEAAASTPKLPADSSAAKTTPHVLSFAEYVAITDVLNKNVNSSEVVDAMLAGFVNTDINPDFDNLKLRQVFDGNYDKLSVAILYGDKALTSIKQVAIAADGKVLEAEALNDFKFLAACALDKCDVLYFTFFKFVGDKVTMNFPSFLKRVGDQYVIAISRPKAYYEEEAKKRATQAPAAAQN